MAITDMKKVELLGILGKKFGRAFNFDIKSPSEAIRALCINMPEFKQFLLDSDKKGIAYRVIVGKEDQAVEDLHNPLGKQSIKIVPVLQGEGGGGGGLTQIVVGVVLVAAAFATGGASLAATGALTTTFFGGLAIGMGVSLILGGVVQMLTPVPRLDAGGQYGSIEQNNTQTADNRPSYVFNGAINTTAQGNPVPVGYGRMIVGSSVISASIRAEELA